MKNLSFAEYIWLDNANPVPQIRCKARVMNIPFRPELNDFSDWKCEIANNDSESESASLCILKPVRVYQNPFKGDGNYLVLCEVYDSAGNSHPSNRRSILTGLTNAAGKDIAVWMGCEQIYSVDQGKKESENSKIVDNSHANGVGSEHVSGRDIAEAHAKACLAAGVHFYSFTSHTTPGYWKIQVGYRDLDGETSDILTIADDMWIARYLLSRVGEMYGVKILFGNLFKSDDGKKTDILAYFSTSYTRDPRCGATAIQAIANSLKARHCNQGHFSNSQQKDNLNSQEKDHNHGCECLVRIPTHVIEKGHGYLEYQCDSMVQSDPYQMANFFMSTIVYGDYV